MGRLWGQRNRYARPTKAQDLTLPRQGCFRWYLISGHQAILSYRRFRAEIWMDHALPKFYWDVAGLSGTADSESSIVTLGRGTSTSWAAANREVSWFIRRRIIRQMLLVHPLTAGLSKRLQRIATK